MKKLLLGIVAAATVSSSASALDIFPGAVGYGKSVTAGRGGALCFVTTTADSGAGSLRNCLANVSGNRTVIFRTGGNIRLGSQLLAFNGSVRVAGQTAPGGGISIETADNTSWCGAMVLFKGGSAGNTLIEHVRFRPGKPSSSSCRHDAFLADNIGAAGLYLRHVSVEGGSDENIDLYRDVSNVTFDRIISAYGLLSHSKGMLLCDDGPSCGKITIYRSLFASNLDRNPDLHNAGLAATIVDFIQNIVYNPADGIEMWAYQGGAWANVVASDFRAGPNSSSATAALHTWDIGATGTNLKFYFPRTTATSSDSVSNLANWVVKNNGFGTEVASPLAPLSAPINYTAANVWNATKANIGASVPSRDALDAAIVACVEARSGCPHVTQLPSRPTLSAGTAPTDSDNDGMPDAWETANGTNPAVADNNGDINANGYTNLEDYLNSL